MPEAGTVDMKPEAGTVDMKPEVVAGAQQSASPVGRSHCAGVPRIVRLRNQRNPHLRGSFTAALHPEGRAPWALGPGGQVLAAGGESVTRGKLTVLASAELYTP
jgi:hypothetical protein